MSAKLIAAYDSGMPVDPVDRELEQEITYQIEKFVIEGRTPRSIQDIAAQVGVSESEALTYMELVTKQQHWVRRTTGGPLEGFHIRFVNRDGSEGYVFESDVPTL